MEIALDTLSARPPFVKAGVPLREIPVTARTATAPSPAALLGPEVPCSASRTQAAAQPSRDNLEPAAA